jgi:hypothetical protein
MCPAYGCVRKRGFCILSNRAYCRLGLSPGARHCRCPNSSVLSCLSSRHIRGDVYVNGRRLKWNAGDFVLSGAQPRPGTTIARETGEIVKVLAPEYGRNANRIVVSRGDDAVFVIEWCDESPKCRPVNQRLIGKCHEHSLAQIVR